MIEDKMAGDVIDYFHKNNFRPIPRKALVLKYKENRDKITYLHSKGIINSASRGGNQYYPIFNSLIVSSSAHAQKVLKTIKDIYPYLYNKFTSSVENVNSSIDELTLEFSLDKKHLAEVLYYLNTEHNVISVHCSEESYKETSDLNLSIMDLSRIDEVQIWEGIVDFSDFDDFLDNKKKVVEKVVSGLSKNNQRDRITCRRKTRELLKESPCRTIASVIRELKKEYQFTWKDTTIRKWIKDLFSNAKAGRPPNT